MDTIQIDSSKILIVENKISTQTKLCNDKSLLRKIRTIDPTPYYESVINDHKHIISAYEQFPDSVHLSNTNYLKNTLIDYDRDGNPVNINRAIGALLRTNFRPVGIHRSDSVDGPENACYFSETENVYTRVISIPVNTIYATVDI